MYQFNLKIEALCSSEMSVETAYTLTTLVIFKQEYALNFTVNIPQFFTEDQNNNFHVTFNIQTLLPIAMSGERTKGTSTITRDLQCTRNLRKGTVISTETPSTHYRTKINEINYFCFTVYFVTDITELYLRQQNS